MAGAKTKLAQINEQVAALQQRRADLVDKIRRTHLEEDRLRQAAIENDPTKRSDAGGALSPIAKVLRARRDSDADVESIDRELAAAALVRERFQHEVTAEQAEILAAEVVELDAQESALIAKMTDWLEDGLDRWAEVVEFWGNRQYHEFRAESCGDGGLEVAMANARGPMVEPQPLDFLALVEMLYEICLDPRDRDARNGGPVSLNGTAFRGWLEATRDLREKQIIARRPPNARPVYSSEASRLTLAGAGRGVIPEWRTGVERQVWG